MTFFDKLQAHKGGLIKVNLSGREQNLLNGEIGMICGVTHTGGLGEVTWVTLLIDGKVNDFLLLEDEVEFLK